MFCRVCANPIDVVLESAQAIVSELVAQGAEEADGINVKFFMLHFPAWPSIAVLTALENWESLNVIECVPAHVRQPGVEIGVFRFCRVAA